MISAVALLCIVASLALIVHFFGSPKVLVATAGSFVENTKNKKRAYKSLRLHQGVNYDAIGLSRDECIVGMAEGSCVAPFGLDNRELFAAKRFSHGMKLSDGNLILIKLDPHQFPNTNYTYKIRRFRSIDESNCVVTDYFQQGILTKSEYSHKLEDILGIVVCTLH
jgi:hypothetical protein